MTFESILHPGNSHELSELISHEDWNLVMMYLQSNNYRGAASKWITIPGFFDGEFDSRVLPIHHACALRPPKEALDKLIRCYPDGLKMKENAFNRLPLHIACLTSAPVEMVETLIKNYPEAAMHKDCIGRLPIHYACAHDVEKDVISILLRAFPASAGCADNNGWLPIHVACRRGLSVDVVRQLIKCFPPSVEMPTKKGSTAMSCAQRGGTRDLIDVLNEELMGQSNDPWGKKLDDPQKEVGLSTSGLRHRHVHANGA